jgi:uncharacterized protein (TIGR03067 family)
MIAVCFTLAGVLQPGVAAPARPLYLPPENGSGLQGMWRQVQGGFEGWLQAPAEMNHWRIAGDNITILIQNADRGSWTFRVHDVNGAIAQLDLTPVNAPKVTYPCLMRIEENRITVCLQNYPERGRPTNFESRPNSGIGYYVYERLP